MDSAEYDASGVCHVPVDAAGLHIDALIPRAVMEHVYVRLASRVLRAVAAAGRDDRRVIVSMAGGAGAGMCWRLWVMVGVVGGGWW
jgi:hypothetical protein